MGALAEYVKKKYGVHTRSFPDPETVSCLTTVTEILRDNPDRLSFTIINLGGTSMFVAWDRGVGSTHGILVAANGGTFSLNADDDGELVGYAIFGISVTSANDIYTMVTEAA